MSATHGKISAELLDAFSNYVNSRMCLHYPPERRHDLERGLLRAAPELGFENAESCVRHLLLSPLEKGEIEILASHLTVGETYFFRNEKLFEILETAILPPLLAEKRTGGQQLRIWSAGCATGEEPYSIAMLLRKMIPDLETWNIMLLGTDINPIFLHRSMAGSYGEWSFRGVQPWIKDRYFRKTAHGRREILPEIKRQVQFSYLNLAEDLYPSLTNNTNAIDIIFCRNVMMYFSKERQSEVIAKLYRCLVDGGLLIVSPAEISLTHSSPFVQEHVQGVTLFRKNPGKDEGRLTIDEGRETKSFIFTANEKSDLSSSVVMLQSGTKDEIVPRPSELGEQSSLIPRELPSSIDPYTEALALFESGRLADAEKKIIAHLVLSGDHAGAFALLARIRANSGRLAEARELCGKAIAGDKLNPGYQYLMAMIQLELGLEDDMSASLKRALYLDQNFVLAHFSLGNVALRLGKTAEASRHFENALSALKTCARDDIVPESDGVTAGRMEEIIRSTAEEVKVT